MNGGTVSEAELRGELVRVGRVLYERGLTVANGGNLSARLSDATILITPTGLCKGRLDEKQLLVLRVADGAVLAGEPGLAPSSEANIHAEVYRRHPAISAVIHAHSPFVTALAITGTPFPDDVLPEVVRGLGAVPTTRLATLSTQDYLDAVTELVADHQAIVLNHHGAMTVGQDLESALFALEKMEHTAHVVWIAKGFGTVERLSPAMITELRAQRH
jgi:L-fuculose-phosphate aldolase